MDLNDLDEVVDSKSKECQRHWNLPLVSTSSLMWAPQLKANLLRYVSPVFQQAHEG